MVFQDVAFLSPGPRFTPHSSKFVTEVNTSGLPHVLKVWLGVSKCMHPVKFFCSPKCSFCASKNFMKILRLTQSLGKPGHPQYLG